MTLPGKRQPCQPISTRGLVWLAPLPLWGLALMQLLWGWM